MRSRGDGSTLNLDFTGGSLDPRVVLTRSAATATYINSSGYVASAAVNEARFDYNPTTLAAKGLLIEGSATNLLKFSVYADTNWLAVGGYSRSYTTVTSPANDSTAAKVTFSATGHGLYSNASLMGYTNSVSSVYTWSAWIRATVNTTNLNIRLGDSNATLPANTAITTTWTRYSYSYTATSNSGPYLASASGTATGEFEMWGFQLEIGTGASSYIPTTTAQVTRNPDLALMTSTNFSSWFTGGTAGTFFVDFHGGVRGITSTVRSVISTNDQTTKHLHLQQASAAGVLKVADFGAVNSVSTANTITSGARTKGAFNFDGATTTVNLCLNGGTVATSSAIAFSVAPTWLVLGGTSTDGSTLTDLTTVLNGSIRQIKYYPTALTSAQLIAMTT
jgi:hypothetical protein